MKQPPLVVAQAAVVRLGWSLGDDVGFNVYGARVGTTVINQALAEALGTAIKTAFTTNLASFMNVTTALDRVGIRDIRAANLPEYRDTGARVFGTEPGVDALPKGLATCVTLRTAATGRSFRGRSYISGWSETSNDQNGFTGSGANTAALNFLSAIRSAFTTNGLTMVVLSRPSFRTTIVETSYDAAGNVLETHTATHNARPGLITDVVALESRNTRWEYQRRRDNGRGLGSAALLTPVAQVRFDG
jgi:hypothetical protein